MNYTQTMAVMDFGSETDRAVVAEAGVNGSWKIIGYYSSFAERGENRNFHNIENLRHRINLVLEGAQLKAGRMIEGVSASVGGALIDSIPSKGAVPISSRRGEVSLNDIRKVEEYARTIPISAGRSVLQVLPKYYGVDGIYGIRDPLNMVGVRLEVAVLILTIFTSVMDNVSQAFQRTGYKLRDITLGTIAAASAILNQDEWAMGVLLIDIGALKTDFILVKDGAACLTGSVPVGGRTATSDISTVLNIAMETAEQLKVKSSSCWPEYNSTDDEAFVQSMGGQNTVHVSPAELIRILEPRMSEVFSLIWNKIKSSLSADKYPQGVVITGGGALMNGVAELAHHQFRLPVRIGKPRSSLRLPMECQDPRWSTVIGMLQPTLTGGPVVDEQPEEKTPGIGRKIMNWFGQFF
ncbi:MAG: cell division protein FtsA [Spirochaeta sp. LUC14_002_19_P3]|nr:MAG: cell division protein FtsA [Spirochaeta sp. LUC14_002_19_P3]